MIRMQIRFAILADVLTREGQHSDCPRPRTDSQEGESRTVQVLMGVANRKLEVPDRKNRACSDTKRTLMCLERMLRSPFLFRQYSGTVRHCTWSRYGSTCARGLCRLPISRKLSRCHTHRPVPKACSQPLLALPRGVLRASYLKSASPCACGPADCGVWAKQQSPQLPVNRPWH